MEGERRGERRKAGWRDEELQGLQGFVRSRTHRRERHAKAQRERILQLCSTYVSAHLCACVDANDLRAHRQLRLIRA